MGVHKCFHFCSWRAASPFELIKNALYIHTHRQEQNGLFLDVYNNNTRPCWCDCAAKLRNMHPSTVMYVLPEQELNIMCIFSHCPKSKEKQKGDSEGS